MVDIEKWPVVSKKSRSFKEIADGLIQQLEFITGNGLLDRNSDIEKLVM
jgi:hypothetical protein